MCHYILLQIDSSKVVKHSDVASTYDADEKLTILFWNRFWNWGYFGMGVGNRGFVSNKCEYSNCYTTNMRKKLMSRSTRIDAIVVHGWDEDLARLANTNVRVNFVGLVGEYRLKYEYRSS